jgi:S-DNA-T family DNA segregation ATPase FtsK/SpoIIIE
MVPMEKKSHFLPESISALLRNLALRGAGVVFGVLSLWLVFSLFFSNPYLSGFGAHGSFGNQGITGNIIAFIRYMVGFIPALFLFLCLGRFGVSLFIGWDEERAPEYNLLRGFVALCVGSAGLGLMAVSKTFGGLAGAIVAADVGPVLGMVAFPVGILLFCLFLVMAGILLHVKWYHVKKAVETTYRLIRVVLSAFHIIAPVESTDDDTEEEIEEEPEEDDEDEEEKPKRRRKVVRKTKSENQNVVHEYELPDPELLEKSVFGKNVITPEFRQTAQLLQDHFEEFGIYGKVVGIKPGPIVTQYEFEPEPGTRIAKVTDTASDMTRAMAAEKIRITPIPGTQYIGIEMVNLDRKTVRYQTLMSNPAFVNSKYAIPLALGVNISGEPVYYDLAKMPHMMIAGRTGSGKSVFVQSIITSIVYHFTPDKCKLMIVDPKAVDFASWDNIPHLITPVVTDATEAVNALKWSVRDMEDRYQKLKKMGVRNIGEYNAKVAQLRESGEVLTEQVVVGTDEETGEFEYETRAIDLSDMAYLVIIIDEVADLMTIARKDVEMCVQRLAQKARAAGIHLVMATQRPSADVITGVIKSNFPTRISFQARSNIDSMTTLGEKGAEQLLPCGDMLFSEAGRAPVRIHGAFVSGEEVNRVADFLREQGEAEYAEGITSEDDGGFADSIPGMVSSKEAKSNDLYEQAKEIVLRDKKPTISYIQRRLGIGYNKAATLIERMESEGVISSPDAGGKRHII